MTKSLLRKLTPWACFFLLFSYDQYRMQIGAIGALLALLILSRKKSYSGITLNWSGVFAFILIIISLSLFLGSHVNIEAPLVTNIILTITAWLSLLLDKPFIFEYTKRSVAKEYWQTMLFSRINSYLTVLWSIAFSALTILSILFYYHVGDPIWVGQLLPITFILLTIWLTVWFPDWCRREELGRSGLITLEGLSDLYEVKLATEKMSYRTIGHGMPLMMLPASYMSMYSWDPEFIKHLAKRYQIILIDYPGVGESELEKPIADINELALVIKELTDALGLKKAIFLGYALGSWVAQSLAIKYPKLVEGLILIASDTGGSRANAIPKEIIKILHDHSGNMIEQNNRLIEVLFPKSVVSEYREKMYDILRASELVHKTSEQVADQYEKMIEDWYAGGGTYQRLADIYVPSLVILGGLDSVIHRQNSLLLKNSIQQAKLIEFSDAGHGVIYQYPTKIANAIIQFFKEEI